MSVGKRVAYIKGLAKGMEIDTGSKEGKLLVELIDVLEDVAKEIEELQEDVEYLDEEMTSLSDDVDFLEDMVLDIDEEDDFDLDEEPVFYQVKCPSCDNEITIDEDVFELGRIECPKCKEQLEFDVGDIEGDCDCGHEH